MMFLPLLRDFDRIHEYSWGGATKADMKEMARPLVLLQVWAWERLSKIAPSRKCNIAAGERAIGEGICRWRIPFSYENLPDRVLRQFGRVQSVPDRFDAHLAMHFRDRRGKMAIDWAKEYQTFTDEWNNRRNTIVNAKRSDKVLTSSDPYMLWFHRHTRLVLSNPSNIAAFEYQGVRGSLEGLVRGVARAYHLADAAHITRDGREALVPLLTYGS
ncbi:hypothetical protein ACSBR1_030815 [Camellia fascicularis]